jgi:MFS family permease
MLLGLLLAVIFTAVIRENQKLFVNMFLIVFVLFGGGWATLNVHSYVMSVEMATKKNTAFFTGLYYVFGMGAQALTAPIAGAVMDIPTGGGTLGITALFPYALIFTALSFITMLFVKHGNAKEINTQKGGAKHS